MCLEGNQCLLYTTQGMYFIIQVYLEETVEPEQVKIDFSDGMKFYIDSQTYMVQTYQS